MFRLCAAALAVLLTSPIAIAAGKKKGAPAAPTTPSADDKPTAPDQPAEGTGQHGEGDYGGVVPGQTQRTEPGKRAKRPPPKGTLAWVGFDTKSTGTDVFLQSIAPFDVSQHLEGAVLVVELAGVTKLGQNAWRPIDTRFFGGPVAHIVARKVSATRGKNAHAAGVEVRIQFKNAKDAHEATLRTANESDGMFYAHLGFAGGTTTDQPTVQEPEK